MATDIKKVDHKVRNRDRTIDCKSMEVKDMGLSQELLL